MIAAKARADITGVYTMHEPGFTTRLDRAQAFREQAVADRQLPGSAPIVGALNVPTNDFSLKIGSVPREVAEDLVKHTWCSSTSSIRQVVYRYDAAEDLRRLAAPIDVLYIHGFRVIRIPAWH